MALGKSNQLCVFLNQRCVNSVNMTASAALERRELMDENGNVSTMAIYLWNFFIIELFSFHTEFSWILRSLFRASKTRLSPA